MGPTATSKLRASTPSHPQCTLMSSLRLWQLAYRKPYAWRRQKRHIITPKTLDSSLLLSMTSCWHRSGLLLMNGLGRSRLTSTFMKPLQCWDCWSTRLLSPLRLALLWGSTLMLDFVLLQRVVPLPMDFVLCFVGPLVYAWQGVCTRPIFLLLLAGTQVTAPLGTSISLSLWRMDFAVPFRLRSCLPYRLPRGSGVSFRIGPGCCCFC